MKTQDQFLARIRAAPLFANVGGAAAETSVRALSSLSPWGNDIDAIDADNLIADEMDWLPTIRDQADPFYPGGLDSMVKSEEEMKNLKSYRLDVYKAVLARLRGVEMTRLKAGANNFEEAAKGAIAYAFRNAATEIALGTHGRWLEVAEIYFKGYWPCGVTKAGRLVVF